MVTHRTLLISLAAAALLAAPLRGARAQEATQLIGFRLDATDGGALDDASRLLISATATGQSAASVRVSAARWSVATNRDGTKVTASVGEHTPPGFKLSVK